jgi:DNA-binding MarR family transcriptional regulator
MKSMTENTVHGMNPFSPQFGRRPEQFVGRDSIINDFIYNIQNQNSPHRATILTGIRGAGKTAILSDVESALSAREYMVVSVTSNDGMLQNILDVFALRSGKRFGRRSAKIGGVSGGALGFSFGVQMKQDKDARGFRYMLTSALDELKKKNIATVVLVDEVHNDTPEMRELAITYQHLIREGYDVSLMMAGLPGSVSDVLNDKVLTFLRRAHRVHLLNVDIRAVEVAFDAAFTGDGRDFRGDSLAAAAKGTYGYPYLIQLVGYYLWKNAGKTIGEADVARALKLSKIDLFQNIHDLIYHELSERDKDFLAAMSEDGEESSFGAIAERMGVTSGYASKYRERLLKAGVVFSGGYGKLTFAPPYMAEYLQKDAGGRTNG